jgi:uncharacterized protein YhaN
LREEYNESKENNLKRKEIERHIKKIKAQIKSFNTQARECEKRIAVLLKGGGSKDEDQFRKRNKLYLERNRLLNDIANTERNLMKISGETDMTVLKDQLRAMTVDRLTDDLNDIGTRQKEIEEELNSLRQRKADLTHEMNSIASSDDISRLRTEEERLLEEIRDAAADWGSHALAAHLLEEAKRKFEQEQQPRVIRDAANFFKTITGDYYHKIIAPIGEDTIEIVTRDHKRKGPEELSRGTAEQLYLAVRFGYISNYSVNGERLPIIMDDILVNFDPYRASQSAKSIFQLSKTHQILYFSCHPETMAIFKKHAPQIPLYFLEEGNVKTVIKEKLDFKGKVKKDEAPKV